MSVLDRRSMLGIMIGGGVAATFAVTMAPSPAESMNLPLGAGRAPAAENTATAENIEKAVVVVRRPARRRVCWWRGGRRVCGWR